MDDIMTVMRDCLQMFSRLQTHRLMLRGGPCHIWSMAELGMNIYLSSRKTHENRQTNGQMYYMKPNTRFLE